jgi:anti-anti-sigma factor
MDLSLTSLEKYDIINLQGDLKVNTLPLISPGLSNYIASNPNKDLVLNLADVNFIDSSTIKLFLNLHKRMDACKRRLYLLKPTVDVVKMLCDVKLDGVLALIDTNESLEQSMSSAFFARYVPYTLNENGMHRLCCTCPVCGSRNVRGYLIDLNGYEWTWENDQVFPQSRIKTSHVPFDAMGHLPIVCTDCYLCSINVADFSAHVDGGDTIKSVVPEDAKLLLSKSMKNRKKMMEIGLVMGDDFFCNPRGPVACLNLFLLAESCSRSMAVNRACSSPFWIGYHNYWAMKYASFDKKDHLINNCRTWMTQVLNEKANYNSCQLSKAYFILLICAISIQKPKEAAKINADYAAFMDALPQNVKDGLSGVDGPAFWFAQAQVIWNKEINQKSEAFNI